MRNSVLLLAAVLLIAACNNDKKEKSTGKNADVDAKHLITKEGIGDIKIGMTRTDLEKLLNQTLVMKHANDTGEVWADTAIAKYGDIEVSLYFEKVYSEVPTKEMELFGVGTSSPLCKTPTGIGVGDDRNAVLAAYEDNPINMGPESVMVNDTTWALSKTDYYINVNDDKWDKELVFRLVNKKIVTIEASVQMGD